MSHSKIASQTQADIRVQGQIDQFFSRFRIGSLLHRCGVRKRNGHSVRSLIKTIFTLPFVGQNFFRGIVINTELPFGKDAAYEILKGSTYNWRRLLLLLAGRLFTQFDRLTDDERDCVLILDDSTYDRSRSQGRRASHARLGPQRQSFYKGLPNVDTLLVRWCQLPAG